MKRHCVWVVLLLLISLLLPGLAEQACFQATARVNFSLRDKARDNSRRLVQLEKGDKVQILEQGTEWCKLSFKGQTGYARTRWLSRYRSLDPIKYPVPGYTQQRGVLRLERDASLSVPGYSGNSLHAGTLVVVAEWQQGQAILPMMRAQATLKASQSAFIPFVPWQKAQPGDLLYGFTTYYNQQTGGRLAASRAFNIELAAQRLQDTLIQPQAMFSFNQVCAPYKKFNGYQLAPIVGGEGTGYGGGVCQLSTTLYNAALGLPLRVDAWEVHKEAGVPYVPQYFDAAVGLYSDLQLTNLMPYAIALKILTQDGALTVLVYRAEKAACAN